MNPPKRGYRDPRRALALGNRLRNRAHELGMSYTELAKKAGLPYKTLMNYLDGKRTPDPFTLGDIAATLGTSPEALQTQQLFLPSVEPELFAARTRLHKSLGELWADDLLFVNELIMILQARRSEENRRAAFHPLVFDAVQRIHREVIPHIIREYAPAHLTAGYRTARSGHVMFEISCACSPGTDIAGCREKIGDYLTEKFKLGRRELTVTDAPNFDMQFIFSVGVNTNWSAEEIESEDRPPRWNGSGQQRRKNVPRPYRQRPLRIRPA